MSGGPTPAPTPASTPGPSGVLQRFLTALFRRPRVIVAIISACTLFFAAQLPRVQIDNDVMNFIPAEHPDKLAFEHMDDIYDADLAMVVGIQSLSGAILSADGIYLIDRISTEIENFPGVSGVTSLTSVDFIQADEEGLRAGPLVADFEGTDREINELRRRIASWPAYDRSLVSDDMSATQLVVTIQPKLPVEQREAIYLAIRAIADENSGDEYRFFIAGEPVLTLLMTDNIRTDIVVLIPIVVVVVLLALYIFFRRLAGVVLPMVAVLVSTIWTVGLMALLGVKLSMAATVIPVLMIAVGSAYGIHIVSHYFRKIDDRRQSSPDDAGAADGAAFSAVDHRTILFSVLKDVGMPVLMAGVTTIIGFGALMTSEVLPMRDFGIFTAVGVGVALMVALTLIPSLLLLHPPVVRPTGSDTAAGHGLLIVLYRYFATSRVRVIVVSSIIAAAAVYGTSLLVVDNELVTYFKGDTEIRRSDEFLRENFLGTRSFDINVVGSAPGDLTKPEILSVMDDLAIHLETTHPEISKVLSYTDFIKRMNQVLNADVPSPYANQSAGPVASGASVEAVSAAAPVPPPAPTGSFGDAGGFDDAGGFGTEGFGAEGFGTGGFGDAGFGADTFSDFGAEPAPPGPSAFVESTSSAGRATTADLVELLNDALMLADTSVVTAGDLVRLVNRRTNYEGAAYYEIPSDPSRYPVETEAELQNLITQYLLLYSGNLSGWADDALEPMQARMSVQLLTTGNQFTEVVIQEIQEYADAHLPPGYHIEIAGVAVVEQALTRLITNAQIRSMIISLSLVFLVVALTFRSLLAGVYGVIPLGLTLIINFGVMGFAGITLDISTAMVASIAIGIGIDYTIHFLSAYHRERAKSDNLEAVEINVLSTTGKAIIFNALSVGAGFAVLSFSTFNPLMYMGILIALTMITSSITAMTILPVLLDVFKPRFIQPREGKA